MIDRPETVREQYSTADKLNTRISIHDKYSTNKQGFGNWITSHYRIFPGMSVLELGCGTGDMWAGHEDLIKNCAPLILSDFSEGMVKTAEERLKGIPGIEYRVIDIMDIPYPDAAFDIVIANMMLYHVPDLDQGLREVRRVLKEGGTFYCATFGEHGMMEYITGLFQDYNITSKVNYGFTLQNGTDRLRPYFTDVRMLQYEDSLAVTNLDDLVDYIKSLTGMSELKNLPRETLRQVLEQHMEDGVFKVPKEYGMFKARKIY